MNLEAKQIQWYKTTLEFQTASTPETLKAPTDQRQYLENRIEMAFKSGIDAGKRIAVERVQQKISNAINDL